MMAEACTQPSRLNLLSLAVALFIMVGGTVYPPVMADASGRVDHGLALALFWAMSAGFVHGVGFVPRHRVWRWLWGGLSVVTALGVAVVLKLQH